MRLKWPSDSILKIINKCLLAVIIFCNGFVLLLPLWPQVSFVIDSKITKPVKVNLSEDSVLSSVDRSYNHLVIPKLQLDERIHEGTDPSTAHRGAWRRPQTSTPGQGSNTVIVGHRFTYTGPSIFYHLDKLKPDDEILVVWNGSLYLYQVNRSRTVLPTELSVEAPSKDELLTLYTCHPLWSVQQRLVVTATLERKIK